MGGGVVEWHLGRYARASLTFGGGVGTAVAAAMGAGHDAPVLALVGMAALFAGASRAVLASVVFAFEATEQPGTVLPLLAGAMVA